MDHQFEKPVPVILGTIHHVVASTKEASEMLVSRWPIVGDGSRGAAKRALRAAMDGKRNSRLIKKAREAFVAAAAEADVLMYERSQQT